MRRLLILPLVLITACDRETTLRMPREAPPAAAVVAPGMGTETLDEQLRNFEAEIRRASAGDPQRLLTAEAISDQLIHARRSVDWLAGGYSVEARLRQLQTMADRIVSLLRRGASLESVADEVAIMLTAVQDLRRQLENEGGGAAPPSLQALLEQDPLRDVEAASLSGVTGGAAAPADSMVEPRVRPVQSGPIGTPITPPDTTPGG